jgi:hypothetical protein
MYYNKKPHDADSVRNISNFHAFGQAGMSVHFTTVSHKHSNILLLQLPESWKKSYKSIILGVIFFILRVVFKELDIFFMMTCLFLHFLPLFCSCKFRRLDSVQFLCSQAHVLPGWRPETRRFTLYSTTILYVTSSDCVFYNPSARTTQKIS